jgi:hypothetical protein
MLPGWEDLFRKLWRLPVWGPLAAGIERLGRLPRIEVPPVAPGGPRPLDALGDDPGGAGLVAGAAAEDITPPPGCNLAGFGFERRATAVRDPLFARALVLASGGTPLALVALDLIGLSAARTARLKALLTARHPDHVWLVSTHNHQSPDTLGLWGPGLLGVFPRKSGLDLAYLALVEERVLAAVERAVAAARPARLHLASAGFDAEGRWVHNERSPVLDRELRVLLLTDQAGRTIATLAQHACHPETLWSDGTRVSADFCGVVCRRLEAELGGVGLYLNGALGAMVSAAVGHATPAAEREDLVDGLGEALGRAALALAAEARRAGPQPSGLEVRRAEVALPAGESSLYRMLLALGIVERRPIAGGIRTEVSYARLGPASLLGLPGEPAPELGLSLVSRLPGAPRFLFGLCNDELGYLLPPEFFADRAYAYEQTMTPGPSTAGELTRAVERLVRAGG